MKIEAATREQIVRNAFLSLFIYLLPVALMFLTFLITSERPWEKKVKKQTNVKTITIKNSTNNGSSD